MNVPSVRTGDCSRSVPVVTLCAPTIPLMPCVNGPPSHHCSHGRAKPPSQAPGTLPDNVSLSESAAATRNGIVRRWKRCRHLARSFSHPDEKRRTHEPDEDDDTEPASLHQPVRSLAPDLSIAHTPDALSLRGHPRADSPAHLYADCSFVAARLRSLYSTSRYTHSYGVRISRVVRSALHKPMVPVQPPH